jgi:outer membrane protein W
VKFIRKCLPLAVLLCVGGVAANAQSGVDAFFGIGTAHDSASGQSIDAFQTGNFVPTPSLGGVFGKFGADIMFTNHFGVGGEADVRFKQAPYSGLNYRPTFYDVYGIWEPIRGKRVTPQIEAGLGAANIKFYYPSSYCDQFAGCSSSNSYIESSNHFQAHFGLGVNFYATQHVFLRPQVDIHWVNNFFQFGSAWVPEYTLSVGYRFGDH